MEDKAEEPKTQQELLEEKMDKAIGVVLGQVITSLKPTEAVQQADAVMKMVQARQQLIATRKEALRK